MPTNSGVYDLGAYASDCHKGRHPAEKQLTKETTRNNLIGRRGLGVRPRSGHPTPPVNKRDDCGILYTAGISTPQPREGTRDELGFAALPSGGTLPGRHVDTACPLHRDPPYTRPPKLPPRSYGTLLSPTTPRNQGDSTVPGLPSRPRSKGTHDTDTRDLVSETLRWGPENHKG